LVLQLMPD